MNIYIAQLEKTRPKTYYTVQALRGLAALSGRKLSVNSAQMLLPFMILIIALTNLLPNEVCQELRVILWGIPSGLLIWCAISLEQHCGKKLAGIPNLLGDASYAIYLVHGFVLPFVSLVIIKLQWHSAANLFIVCSLCLILSSVAGIAIHRLVEKPMIKRLKEHFSLKNKPIA